MSCQFIKTNVWEVVCYKCKIHIVGKNPFLRVYNILYLTVSHGFTKKKKK